jgi:phosphate transport system substrate-binding protein
MDAACAADIEVTMLDRRFDSRAQLRTSLTFLSALAWTLAVWAQSGANVRLIGVGGTFPQPIYAKWFQEYAKLHPDVDFRYLPLGSGQGIQKVTSGEVDYGGSDAPLNDKQLAEADVKVLHFPSVISATVPIYNVPGVEAPLKFTAQALAGIYLGSITEWNDPAISRVNSQIQLPASRIVVIHTANGRGTTYVWSDYLSKVSPEWKARIGRGTAVEWPVGTPAEGNGNVAKVVKETPNAIGYVELPFALANSLSYGSVQNSAGNFVSASLGSVTAAAAAMAKNIHADFRASLTNPSDEKAYPIASFTWILVPKTISNIDKRNEIVKFLRWMLTDGQTYPKLLNYAPLPEEIVAKELIAVESISGP